jgi:hypothetical protein
VSDPRPLGRTDGLFLGVLDEAHAHFCLRQLCWL